MNSINKNLRIAFIIAAIFILCVGVLSVVQYGRIVEDPALAERATLTTIVVVVALVAAGLVIGISAIRKVRKSMYWYESILDSIPFPVSVTDNKMNWTFINKPVEDMLGVERRDVLGKPCSNWGAAICGGNNCGISCLKRGEMRTTFEQGEGSFQVDVAYLKDEGDKTIGHIEVVQDISPMVEMQKKQAVLVEQISDLSSGFASATSNIASGAQALAQGATQQAASVEEVSSALNNVEDQAKTTMKEAQKSTADVEKAGEYMGLSLESMTEMTTAMLEISESSSNISKVIKVIEDIAFQTNILALNAAVEAARAGEAGKGFAVVADEVRNLASKSAEAAKETSVLIESSVQKVGEGNEIAAKTSGHLNEVAEIAGKNAVSMKKISEMSKAQTEAIVEITESMRQINDVVQSNSATSQESAAASEELSSQTDMLRELLDNYNKTS